MKTNEELTRVLSQLIAQTNGITLTDSLLLLLRYDSGVSPEVMADLHRFWQLLSSYHREDTAIEQLLEHPVAQSLGQYLRAFPLRYREEHIHLTGSLSAAFIFQEITPLLQGPEAKAYRARLEGLFGSEVDIEGPEQVDQLLRLKEQEEFDRYLKILEFPAMILKDRATHERAAYHMAKDLYDKHHVGSLRLKYTFSRFSPDPKIVTTSAEDVTLGLYEGFARFKREHPDFDFILSPSFRKESSYYDRRQFASKAEDFNAQVRTLIQLMEKYQELRDHIREVDTVGNERGHYRKGHFRDMQEGFRKLQRRGLEVRSHHGEMWNTLRAGIQAVDNAMNIWRINNLEHGISLGINPNYYFHSLFQRLLKRNALGEPVSPTSREYHELKDMNWKHHNDVCDHLISGNRLNKSQVDAFTKAKFRTATEVESYQHDVLNRMIQKQVSLVALPSSNKRLTGSIADYKDHPFSWWEKKGVQLAVGTDNYITLNTDLIREMLILLFSDPENLKLTKLLMVTTGERRRPYMSHLLWRQGQAF